MTYKILGMKFGTTPKKPEISNNHQGLLIGRKVINVTKATKGSKIDTGVIPLAAAIVLIVFASILLLAGTIASGSRGAFCSPFRFR